MDLSYLFPFENIRKGQKEFLQDVKNAIENKKHLIAHAPTGIGKTAAVLSSSFEYSLKKGKTIFFLTPKHTQHKIVIDTIKRIKSKFGVKIIAVDFIGKQWMCPYPNVRELSSREFNEFCKAQKKDEKCKFYKNSHKRELSSNAKRIIERIQKEALHSEEIKEICERNLFCPYEICVKASSKADVIICDYFHIFSTKVRKAFLSKLEKSLENSIIIVDEAHNLPDRIREILSYSISKFMINRAIKEAKFLHYENLIKALNDINYVLRELCKGLEKDTEKFVEKEEFIERIEKKTELSYDEIQDMLDYTADEILSIPKRYRSYSRMIANFLENWKNDEKGYARILHNIENLKLSYKCLDPGISAKEIFYEVHSAILMSGTLMPLEMYAKVLDLNEERTLMKEYESPFPKENRLTLLVPKLTTQYKKRSELMYSAYAKKISSMLMHIPKNVAVFFPSYDMMNAIIKNLKNLKKEILIEEKEMKKEDRINIFNKLKVLRNGNGGILAGVQAGSFSEGLDYENNLLSAVIVVGLPLEIPSLEVKALIDYYDFKFNRGWDYGYIYPAMNRALQAAGRCIRSETDRGAIIFMDERFRWRNYAKCFPKDFSAIITEIPEKYLDKFFKDKD